MHNGDGFLIEGFGSFESQEGRGGLLQNQLELVKRKDCDRYEIAPIPEALSFEKGFLSFHQGMPSPGAGKTIFCEKILNFMPSIIAIFHG